MRTNDQIRLQNLRLAIGRAGNAAKLAELMGTAPAYISQIKNQAPDSKTGMPKGMGDEFARRIEVALGVETGWMDAPHIQDDGLPFHDPFASDGREASATWNRPAHVQWVSEEEAELLDIFRTTDRDGRDVIKHAASSVTVIPLLAVIANKK